MSASLEFMEIGQMGKKRRAKGQESPDFELARPHRAGLLWRKNISRNYRGFHDRNRFGSGNQRTLKSRKHLLHLTHTHTHTLPPILEIDSIRNEYQRSSSLISATH